MRTIIKKSGHDHLGEQGFTLIETMIGMMIFAVGISAVLYMEVVGISGHRRAREYADEVHGTSLQTESIIAPEPYSSDDLQGDDVGIYYPASSLPIKESNTTSYVVSSDVLVRDTKLIIVSNKRNPDAKIYALRHVKPYIRK